MLNIFRLCEFIKNRVDNSDEGIFFPQDDQYVRTSYMVRDLALEHGKKIYLFSWLNWLIYLMGYFPGKVGKIVNKAFGNLVYEK